MSEIQSNLTSGSVWERKSKRGVKTSVVLMVTNAGLTEEVLAENPQQVVFLTEAGAVLSATPEVFTARRTYIGMNNSITEAVTGLPQLAFEDDDEEDVDIDSTEVDEAQFAKVVGDLVDVANGEGDDEDDGDDDGEEDDNLFINVGPHPHKEALESSFIGYRESPFHTGDTLHTLSFMMDDEVTLQMVHSAFSTYDPNAIQKFEVTLPTMGTLQIEHEGMVGVFVEANGSYCVAHLNLTTKGDFRAEINDAQAAWAAAQDTQVVTDVEAKVATDAQAVEAPAEQAETAAAQVTVS